MTEAVKHFTENTLGKDYVVGDIHGCFGKLKVALAEIGFDETKDRLFSVGDLVDRGPDSEAALEWLAKPWFHAVRGNHEAMAMSYVSGYYDRHSYSYHGGQWMIDLHQRNEDHSKLFAEEFSKLPIAIDVTVGGKVYGVIHADCPVKSWKDLDDAFSGDNKESFENAAIWSRDRIDSRNKMVVDDVEIVYVGHTPLKKVMSLGNVLYIDTGACYNGQLTVLEMY